MKTGVIFLLVIFQGATEIMAARSSPRNIQPLQQRGVDDDATEEKAETAVEEADGYEDFDPTKQAAEKYKFSGNKTGWGFVKEKSSYYSPEGKYIGKLKAGTLFKYHDVKTTSSNDMLLSHLRDKTGWHGPYLLPCTGIAAYAGTPEDVDIKIVTDLRRYFLLKGEFEQYREKLLYNEYKKNPFYDLYRHAVEEYKATLEKARKMEQNAAKLTGLQRERAYDELREYKYEQAQVKARMEKTGEKYKAWKKQHPVNPDKIQDEKLLSIQNKMSEIRKRLPDLIPEDN
ncbi:MAG: hypothetical protein R6V06_09915 [Kiritimatiellia bacterium]